MRHLRVRVTLLALVGVLLALSSSPGGTQTANAQTPTGVYPPAALTMFEGDDSIDIKFTGTIPSGRDGDIYIRHATSNVGGTATRSADATCSSGEDFVFLTGENDTISPAAGATDPVYSWTDVAICKDNVDESAETITLVWTSSSGTPFDSSQSHCSSTSACTTTVTIYDSQSITLDAANYQAEEGTAMPVTITVDPAASVDRTFTLETAETGTGAGHADGTDTIGTDYVQGPWNLTIPAGETSVTQHIYIGTDGYDAFAGASVSEGLETFTVRIDAASLHGAMKTGATASATARIIDVRVVPTTWDLLPSGLVAGDRFRLAFVTSNTTASATDIATYNTHVQNNVDETGGIGAGTHTRVKELGGLFFSAAASTATVDAIDNTGMRFNADPPKASA